MSPVVVSLFDGLSGAMLALKSLGIIPSKYYSSEVDRYAIEVSSYNLPEIDPYRLGDVTKVTRADIPESVDLLIGGSPCQSFSMAGKREGMVTTENVEVATLADYIALKEEGFTFKCQSYLFWEYVRLVKELKPKYFVLENVSMTKHWSTIISAAVGVDFTTINSSLLSAQNRKRVYWVAERTPGGTYTQVNIQQPMS